MKNWLAIWFSHSQWVFLRVKEKTNVGTHPNLTTQMRTGLWFVVLLNLTVVKGYGAVVTLGFALFDSVRVCAHYRVVILDWTSTGDRQVGVNPHRMCKY